jgi:hypothetical protein
MCVGLPVPQAGDSIELLQKDHAGQLVIEDHGRQCQDEIGTFQAPRSVAVGPPDLEHHAAAATGRELFKELREIGGAEHLPAFIEHDAPVAGRGLGHQPSTFVFPGQRDIRLAGVSADASRGQEDLLDRDVPADATEVVGSGIICPSRTPPSDTKEEQLHRASGHRGVRLHDGRPIRNDDLDAGSICPHALEVVEDPEGLVKNMDHDSTVVDQDPTGGFQAFHADGMQPKSRADLLVDGTRNGADLSTVGPVHDDEEVAVRSETADVEHDEIFGFLADGGDADGCGER